MQRHTLKAEKRDVVGKRIANLRKNGILPIDLYGRDFASLNLQVSQKDFAKVYRETGKTGLIDIKVDNSTYPSLIKNVQFHPVSDEVLHVEFHKVNLKEKIKANIPVELVGDSPAVANQTGILLQTLNEIEVEALPTDLPESIKIEVAGLEQIDQQITVADVAKIEGVEILTPGEEVIVKVVEAVSQEAQAEAEAEAAAATAEGEAAPAEGQEGGEAAATEEAKEETSKE